MASVGRIMLRDADADDWEKVRGAIKSYQDFPKKGILFHDVLPILYNQETCGVLVNRLRDEQIKLLGLAGRPAVQTALVLAQTKIVGLEARGFLIGGLLAGKVGAPIVAIRKEGKLPSAAGLKGIGFMKEYSESLEHLEVEARSIEPGDEVLVVDDLLATGGSADAAVRLCEDLGAVVKGILVVVELPFL